MLRTIQKAFESIKKEDPDTSITQYSIRKWVKDGLIKYRMSGNKILVDMDSLKNYINMEEKEED